MVIPEDTKRKYEPYPEYRDTGMGWLGQIPVHWDLEPLGINANLMVPMRDKPTEFDGQVPWIRIEDFEGKFIADSRTGQRVSENTIKNMNLRVYPVGTVLCSCSCSMGATAIVTSPLISNQTFIGIIPSRKLLPDYIYYLMQVAKDHLDSIATGSIQQYLSRNDFSRLRIPIFPVQEQRAITDFLDREATRLDELIAKKQRLIELLQEQRTALITHTVTKGLTPDAPKKYGGVEWLGEIPTHWEVNRLKWGVSLINDKVENGETDTIYLGLENVESWTGRIIESDFRPEQEGASNSFRKDDVLFGKLRPYLAKAVHAQYHGICTSELMVLRPQKYYPRYLFYYMLSRSTVNIIDSSTYGVKMPRANWQFIGNLPTPLPPLREQQVIARFLDRETDRIDGLIGRINQAIEKLQEYRSAIITAAVIGKIDVRGEIVRYE